MRRAVELLGDGAGPEASRPEDLDELREDAEGLASSEEELLLLALFGGDAEPLLRSVAVARTSADDSGAAGLTADESERIRELIRVVQESGIGEVTIEEGETRITVRRSDERPEEPVAPVAVPTAPVDGRGRAGPASAAERLHPRRVAHGGNVLPGAAAGRALRSWRRATRSGLVRRSASSRP